MYYNKTIKVWVFTDLQSNSNELQRIIVFRNAASVMFNSKEFEV